jgi:hypothetical protein
MGYYYKIYGLTIHSEIWLPEALECEPAIADVEIMYGVMPYMIRKKRDNQKSDNLIGPGNRWFYIPNEGSFLIQEGTNIIVEKEETADEKHIRSLLLGACLGCVLFQREIIAIHGSAIVLNGKAILISGRSGAGKSTLSTEFRNRGCQFMADDTVALTSTKEGVYAYPSYPQQKLCVDAAIHYGYDLNKLVLLNEDRKKYGIDLSTSFCPEIREVAAFIYLDIYEEDELRIEELNGAEKLNLIIENLYNFIEYSVAGMSPTIFKKCLEITQKIPIIRVRRPEKENTISQIVENLEQQIEMYQ